MVAPSAAVRWMCSGGIQPIRVVHGDGQVISLVPPVKVADVVFSHPHHYICHMSPELPSNKSAMLPLDLELEPGLVYFLLPLPRLFPTSSLSVTPSCCCHSQNGVIDGAAVQTTSIGNKGSFSPMKIMDRLGSPLRRTSAKKVSPELTRCSSPLSKNPYVGRFAAQTGGMANIPPTTGNGGGLGLSSQETSPLLSPSYGSSPRLKRTASPRRCASPKGSPNRLRDSLCSRSLKAGGNLNSGGVGGSPKDIFLCGPRWKPRLGCISETDMFVAACEELRMCLDRRRMTFDGRMRGSAPAGGSPLKFSDVCKVSSPREKDSKPLKDSCGSLVSKDRNSLGGYLFV